MLRAKAGMYALGRLQVGQMNKTEERYARHLDSLKLAGEVLWWKFEGIKLRLAEATFYTPDFAVIVDSHVMELHEVKGYWQDDAKVKIKMAASMYPFRFIAVTHSKKGWEATEF